MSARCDLGTTRMEATKAHRKGTTEAAARTESAARAALPAPRPWPTLQNAGRQGGIVLHTSRAGFGAAAMMYCGAVAAYVRQGASPDAGRLSEST